MCDGNWGAWIPYGKLVGIGERGEMLAFRPVNMQLSFFSFRLV